MSIPPEPPRGPVLALAAFGESASVAVRRDDAPAGLAVVDEIVGQSHSARILPLVSTALARLGLRPADLAGIAFEAGPGAFTSLRVACAIAQGFGLALGVPVCPVGSLEAAAVSLVLARASGAGVTPGPRRVFVANDARMGECYFGVFEVEAPVTGNRARVSTLLEAGCAAPSAVSAALADWAARGPGLAFTGDAPQRHAGIADRLAGLGLATGAARADAAAIAMIAAGPDAPWVDPAAAAPRYVREKVALDVDEQRALRAGRA
jgi:tRNA threonylcarbamoyladenosine biosynthesis protein TsaB